MSGHPGGPSERNGLESLFENLRQQQNRPINLEPSYSYYNNNNNSYFGQPSSQQPQPQPHPQSHSQLPHGYQPPSVTTPVPTPFVLGQQPHHSSAAISPVENMPSPALGGPANSNRTSSLLNLLKFSQPTTSSPTQPAPIGTPLPPSRDTSMSYGTSEMVGQSSAPNLNRGSSDLLAALMGQKPLQQASPQFTTVAQPIQSTFRPTEVAPPSDTQAYLLQLLNQPKPAQQEQPREQTKVFTPPSKASSQNDVNELTQALEESTLDISAALKAQEKVNIPGKENTRDLTPKNPQGLFTYVNPFEKLAASSPRNRTPKNDKSAPSSSTAPTFQILKKPRNEATDNKRKVDEHSSVSSPAHSKRKVESRSQAGTPALDDRAQTESGAFENKETVAEALNDVGDRVGKEVQEAIARAEQKESHASIEKDLRDMLAAETEKEFEEAAVVAAKAIKTELEKEENSHVFDDLPTPVAETVKDIIDDAAQGHIADSWESADAEESPVKGDEESVVKVYNFPMRPWTSIHIKETEEVRPCFRDEVVMDIARLKKEFDQIDRTLVTASNNFIVYGMSKNGGIRIIRQDDGKDTRLFTETHDRIFSVVISASGPDLKESIIGTGISGTVYWAMIKDGEGDHIEDSHPETFGFALPPLNSQDSESPGGVLKTRARKSSAHPDFFAVGRGKYINIIWPSIIIKQSFLKNGKERIVDTEKYLSQHSLRINTSKAGKDFTFSEDDTTIVSLDKAGRVKFWDVRGITRIDSHGKPAHDTPPIEIKEPLITFTTTHATEKSWPTSVLFVDKLRPYQRGGALRYLIVGMKQNHTLQLWDLALGKPVQEIHLPHTKESDAVCSVLYHAATGMIVVGHPTRNSIYFLHLSAPKYNLPRSVSQAEYMEKLVASESSTVKPDSTAVISGMREYSFATKGTLRSLDVLQSPTTSAAAGEPATLFELYAMHSKGVTCLNIKQADLGWTRDNKVIHSVVAEQAGIITIDTLKEIPVNAEITESAQLAPTRIVPRPAKEPMQKEAKKVQHTELAVSAPTSKVEEKAEKKEAHAPAGSSIAAATERTEKKKRRKATSASETPASSSANMPQNTQSSRPLVLDPSSMSRNGNAAKVISTAAAEHAGASKSQEVSVATANNIEVRIAEEVKKLFGNSLDSLYKNIADDRRTQAAVADAKQDSMLRLVSATLSENIEATLAKIVTSSVQKSAVPAILETTTKAVNEQLGPKLNSHLAQNLPRELQKILPDAISRALQQPQLLKLMSESLAQSVAFRVEEQFAVILNDTITPAFNALALQTVQRVSADVQRKAAEQVGAIERQRHADSIKIEKLTQLVTGLTETISSMAAAQSEFQGEFLRVQQQAAMDRRTAAVQSEAQTGPSGSAVPGPRAELVEKPRVLSEFEQIVESIAAAMAEAQYENAIIRLLQSGREQEIFEKYLSNLNPDFLRSLTPLMLLSLGATITTELEGQYILPRVAWLETILATFQAHVNAGQIDEQVQQLVPKIMGIYIQRLEHLFMRISNMSAQDPNLKRLSQMVSTANRILETCQNPGGSSRRGTITSSIMSPAGRRM